MHTKNWLSSLALFSLIIFNPITHSNTLAGDSATESAKNAPWPALPTSGFIQGRAATKADVDKRDAVFAYLNGPTKSIPVDIPVPQYGLVKHNQTGEMIRIIVLQAEKVQGQDMIGYIVIDTKIRAVIPRTRVTFLGSKIE